MMRRALLRSWIWLAVVVLMSWACLGADVVINEVAWGGTAGSASDEWIELYNPTEEAVDLTGWILAFGEKTIELGVEADNTLEVGGYFLLERTDDGTVSDVEADVLYSGTLSNDGTAIELQNADGEVVDRVDAADDGWPAGTATGGEPPYASMERIDPLSDVAEWASNDGRIRNGTDIEGNPLNGTPGQENSVRIVARAAPKVELVSPIEEAAVLSGTVVVAWAATDPDGSAEGLRISLELSMDDGETYEMLVENLANGGSYAWDTTLHPNGDRIRLKIVAEDGSGYRGEAESPVFTVRNGAD